MPRPTVRSTSISDGRLTMNTFQSKIKGITRAQSSKYGNPAYFISFENGMRLRTQTDSSIAYAISNPEFRDALVEVTTNKSGRITHVKVV
jgi:hypothetical protein